MDKNGSSEVKDSHGQESAVCLRFSHDFLQVGRQFQNENLQSPVWPQFLSDQFLHLVGGAITTLKNI